MTYGLLAIAAIFLQTFFDRLNLPAMVVVFAAASKYNPAKIYTFAFAVGLLADLILGNRLGFFAAAFLLLAFLTCLIKLRYAFNLYLTAVFLVLSQIVFYYARGFTW